MSTTGGAGWQPDPFGRHQQRWWDGQNWTEQVADGGVTSTDPPGGAAPISTPPGGGGGGGAKVAVIIGIVVVVALIAGAVLFFVLGSDSGDGTGEFTAELADDSFDFYEVRLSACEAVGAELKPDGFDATLAIGAESISADFFSDEDELDSLQSDFDSLSSDEDLVDLAADRGLTILVAPPSDSGGEDDEERAVAPALEDTTYTVIVGGYDGEGGEYELTIEKLEAPEGEDCDFDDQEGFLEFFSDQEDYYSDFFSEYAAFSFTDEFSSVGSAIDDGGTSTSADCDDLDSMQPGDTVTDTVPSSGDFQICIEVPSDGTDVNVSLTTSEDEDLTLRLYDQDGVELDYSDSGFSGDSEEVEGSALDGGLYLVEVGVFGGGGTGTSFELAYDAS